MRLLHAADLHVGASRTLPQYLRRQERMLQALTELSIEHRVRAALYCGDIFHSAHTKPWEKDMFTEWLIWNDAQGRVHGFDTIIESGNHDEIESGYTHLRPYRKMQEHGLLHTTHIVECDPAWLVIDDVVFVVVPAAKLKGDEINVTVHRLLADARRARGQSIRKVVGMVHEGIDGAQNEAGTWRVRSGPRLDPELVDYWALGDIHKPYQQILANAWYPGSPIQHNFGDPGVRRGALIVDLDHPTEPEPVEVRGVVPLITLHDIPDEWPDAIIRYEGPADEIAESKFPGNVVNFKPVIEETGPVVTVSTDRLRGLDVVLLEDVPAGYRDDVREAIERAARDT